MLRSILICSLKDSITILPRIGFSARQKVQHFNGVLPIDELKISSMGSSGPGGQHVNRTNSKVEIRFHVPTVTFLDDKVKQKLQELYPNQISSGGYFIVKSDSTRKQLLNQADCMRRIRESIWKAERALAPPRELSPDAKQVLQRRAELANERRLAEKRARSMKKFYRERL